MTAKCQKKNKIAMMSIDNNYSMLKQIYCFAAGETPKGLKDTSQLLVKMMKRLKNNREKDDATMHINLL